LFPVAMKECQKSNHLFQSSLVGTSRGNLKDDDRPLPPGWKTVSSRYLPSAEVMSDKKIDSRDTRQRFRLRTVSLLKSSDSKISISTRSLSLGGDGNLHRLLAIGELVLRVVKRSIAGNRNMHEKAPPEIFALVLEELEELIRGGDGNVESNVIARGFGSDEPAFLIGLLGEIPELVERTDDAVVGRCGRSHVVGGRGGA
jgi:hypothetical protein